MFSLQFQLEYFSADLNFCYFHSGVFVLSSDSCLSSPVSSVYFQDRGECGKSQLYKNFPSQKTTKKRPHVYPLVQ